MLTNTLPQSLEARQLAAALTLDNLEDAAERGLLNIPAHLLDETILVIHQQRLILNRETSPEDNLGYVERFIERFTGALK